MADIFDNTIICNKCDVKMRPAHVNKNGFVLRAVACPECKSVIIHPADEQEYNKFVDLKNRDFRVKMRVVGNSYTVSIPKEIVSFIKEQEKIMDDMVRLCFEDFGRLSLNFGNAENGNESRNHTLLKTREVKMVKNGKPVLHTKEFYDSTNPERNQKIFKIGDK